MRRSRGASCSCGTCKVKLVPGEVVVTVSACGHRKIYHQKCYHNRYIGSKPASAGKENPKKRRKR